MNRFAQPRPVEQNVGQDLPGLWLQKEDLAGGPAPSRPLPHLKHHLRSGVPSEFLPTVTISPERKAFLRNTGKERSMSRMVVAHCGEGAGR